jgi:hypothetical protein
MTAYDFKSARQRIEELKLIYRQNKHHHAEDGTWDWWIMAQIEEIEREIAEALKEKTATNDSGTQFGNVITPIVPQWAVNHKGAVTL